MAEKYLFDKEWYKLMNQDESYIAGIKVKGVIRYIYESINKDLKKCIESQLKLMKQYNITFPVYVATCRFDHIKGEYKIKKEQSALEVKYCANCYRQIDADDLDKIEIINGMCFHKEDCQ